MTSQIETLPNCPVCGRTGLECLSHVPDYFYKTTGLWSFSACKFCSHIWLSRRIPESCISEAYKSYYTHGVKPSSSNLRRQCLTTILDRSHHLTFRELRFHDKILDYGCGNGDFLQLLNTMGYFKCTGIDFDASAVSHCMSRGLNATTLSLRQLIDNGSTYDVIIVNHVLEHLYDPVSFLNTVSNLLNPGGRLIIRTPNNQSLLHRLFRVYWRGLEAPRHINLFSSRSLRLACKTTQLRIKSLYSLSSYRSLRSSFLSSSQALLDATNSPFSIVSSRMRYLTILPFLLLSLALNFLRHGGEEIFMVACKGGNDA